MRASDLAGRLTLTVPEAGQLLGIGRDAAYAAVERREIAAHRVGRRLVVPTHTLLREQLGWPDALIAQALGLDPEDTGAATPASAAATAQISPLALLKTTGDSTHGDPAA